MTPIGRALLAFAVSLVRSRMALHIEILALRHQLRGYRRSIRRPQVRLPDRLLQTWLSRRWSRWREVLIFVRPATVIAWQHKRFREHWACLSRTGRPGHPATPTEL